MAKFSVYVYYSTYLERIVEADNLEDAIEIAEGMEVLDEDLHNEMQSNLALCEGESSWSQL